MTKPLLKRLTAALSGILAMALATSLQAAELKVIAGGSMTPLLNHPSAALKPPTGHKLSIHFDSTPNIVARINSGAPFDVVVVPVDVFKDAPARAHLAAGRT